jgi:hypothetical protein
VAIKPNSIRDDPTLGNSPIISRILPINTNIKAIPLIAAIHMGQFIRVEKKTLALKKTYAKK